MDKEASVGDPESLTNAAEGSVKDAVSRGRKRRAGRRGVATDEIRVQAATDSRMDELVDPSKQIPTVPYHKRRRTTLVPGHDDPADDDSNDEWEEHVELDSETVKAGVESVRKHLSNTDKDKVKPPAPTLERHSENIGSPDVDTVPLEPDPKAQQRLKNAAKRKKILRQHSVHIVLSVAHLLRLDEAAQDDELRAFALSVTPDDILLSTTNFVERLAKFGLWLRRFFCCTAMVQKHEGSVPDEGEKRLCSAVERAILAIQERTGDILDVIAAVAALVRDQGFRCRLVSPLQPVSHQLPKITKREHKVTGRKQVIETNPDEYYDTVLYGWVEVWAPDRKKWIPVDILGGCVCAGYATDHLLKSLERIPTSNSKLSDAAVKETKLDQPGRATRSTRRNSHGVDPPQRKLDPLMFSHVVAVEQGMVTDVTRRYARTWKDIEKARAKGKLYAKVIQNLSRGISDPSSDEAHTLELEEFDAIGADDAIPTTMTAVQRHPRYVLERHLKKYEVIFPKEPVVGYIKDEPIFLRANVQLLHTKDRWIRQMREVIEGVAPQKSVRSKNGTDATVDLFGLWQTNPLVIPPCVNGKVPRGLRGNVDLWTPDHLPKGAEHVNMPHAKNAARKLGIEFAPAMTGFDVRGGRSVPRIEGVVVSEENAELLRDAAQAAASAAAERVEKRTRAEALERWLKLLRAVKAREKIKKRYGGMIVDDGTYETVQKREGLRKATAMKEEASSGQNRKHPDKASSALRKRDFPTSESHQHEFGASRRIDGETMAKTCNICGIEVSFETL